MITGSGYPGASNISIIGPGAIVHGATDTSADGNYPLGFAGGNNVLIQNVDAHVLGYNAHIINAEGGSYDMFDIEIDGGTWTTAVTSYTSRCNHDGSAFDLDGNIADPDTTTGYDHQWKIHDITLSGCPGAGIVAAGKVIIYDNNITVDARNDLYSFPSGSVCWGSTNSAAILASQIEAGSQIYGNTLLADTNFAGCDEGILIEMAAGASDDSIKVYGNTINVHRGQDEYYGALNAKGIKMRYHNTYVLIDSNDITVTVADSAAHTSYGPRGVGLEVVSGPFQGSDFARGYGADSNTTWSRNTVKMIAADSQIFNGESGPANNTNAVRVAIRTNRWLGQRAPGASNLANDSTVGTFTETNYLAGGQIDSIRWYGYVASGTQTVCVSVYADNGSRTGPTGAALTSASEEVSAASAAWHTVNVADYGITYGQTYWVMVGSDETGLYVYKATNAADTSFTVNGLCPDPWSGGAIQIGVNYSIGAVVTPADGWTWSGTGNKFQYNNLTSPINVYKVGGFDGNGICNNWLALGDTVAWQDISDSTGNGTEQYLVDIGYDYWCWDNTIKDIVAVGRIDDSLDAGSSIRMWTSGEDGEREIAYDHTFTLTVNGNNALPVSGASYWMIDSYNDTVATGTTPANGIVTGVVRTRREFRVLTDSTGFNDVTFKAKKATDSTSGAVTVAWDNKDTTLVLAATAGEGAVPTRLRGIKP
ncbi:MAG: hypothetical protein ACYS21_07110 [Planctomycetota bacterium]|jgi:hypothetical protein